MIGTILEVMKSKGLSAENIAFGMGGELLQNVNRDTMQFAMKASTIRINGDWQDVYKDPVTDTGKRSKRGRLALIADRQGNYQTIRETELESSENRLEVVYCNGKLLRDENFETIRKRVLM